MARPTLILLVLFLPLIAAQGPPPLPSDYEGAVIWADEELPAGSTVFAQVTSDEGVARSNDEDVVDGWYDNLLVRDASWSHVEQDLHFFLVKPGQEAVLMATIPYAPGEADKRVDLIYDSNLPARVENVEATWDNGVALAWAASPGVEQYRVYRDGTPLKTLKSTEFFDARPVADAYHAYTIAAINAFGEGPPSEPAKLRIPASFVAPAEVEDTPFPWFAPLLALLCARSTAARARASRT